MKEKRCMGCMETYTSDYTVCPHCGYVEGTPADEAVHMAPGTVLEGRYVMGKVLGYGGFGATHIAWDPVLEQKVAIKEYLPSEFSTRMPGEATVTVFGGDRSEQFREGMEKFVEEAKRLSQFRNEPGIVKIFDSFQANSTAYIVMEYLDGETLTSYLEREGTVSEEKVMEMLLPVMQSLQIVHNEGLLHRDIAPDNIFITKSGEVKLIDFGASRYATTSHSRSLTVIIKPGYSPEEQYRSHGDQGPHTDVYALAAVMYKMLTGVTPPDALERRAMIETKKKELLPDVHKEAKYVSPIIENAVLNAMNIQIEDRTADIPSFLAELQAEKPAKRRYGKIKKIDVYAWPLWLKIVIPAVLIASIVTGGLLATDMIHFPSFYSDDIKIPEGMVLVPDVEGMDKDDAINKITKAGLLPSAEGNVSSAYVQAGKIVLQSPYGGNYQVKNGKVMLTVSSGAGIVGVVDGMATVPYIIWDTQDGAIAKLQAAGLGEPIIETAYNNDVAEGNVISQSVEAGTKIAENSTITIVVSLGAKPFEMPDVIGQTKAAAEATLNGKGLVVAFAYVKDNTVPENTVVQQDIPQNTMVKKGMTVTVTVSTKEELISVADVTGTLQASAIRTLEQQGFKVTILENFDETVEKGYVINQTPNGGTGQIKGSTVVITVSKGAPMVTVPNVVGKTQEQATGELKNAGFAVALTQEYSDTVPAGNVIRQSPTGSTSCKKGATVTIVVSMGVKTTPESYFTYSVTNGEATITEFNRNYQGVANIPATLGGYPVVSIGESAFNNCNGLTNVTIPNSVTSIGAEAFYWCEGLTNVTIPNSVTSIGNAAFCECHNLTSVTIPNSVISIGYRAFSVCYRITSLTIGNSVTSIGDYAFSDCGVTSVTIPDSVTSIGNNAFGYCDSLAGIWVEADNPAYSSDAKGVLFDKDKTALIQAPGAITGSYAVPNGVSSIGNRAFCCCDDLTDITIPNSVTRIGDSAFSQCFSLTNVTIGNRVTSIGNNVFGYCDSLAGIWVEADNPAYSSDAKGVLFDKDKTALIQAPGAITGSYAVPNGVSSIGDWAFYDCDSLTDITIPNSVTSIGNYAFFCDKLKTVYFSSEAQKNKFASCFGSNVTLVVQ